MAYDVVIKGGRIYDGSGLPSFTGDVASVPRCKDQLRSLRNS
jgi:N-acyl-D-aspartate/D-glutamate deacylase